MNDTEKLYTVSYNYKIKVYGDRARHLVLVTVYQLVEAASFPLTNACLNSIVKTSQMHYLPPPKNPQLLTIYGISTLRKFLISWPEIYSWGFMTTWLKYIFSLYVISVNSETNL